jgi:CubicO group peptidase (beta-lactamase class C family)
MDPRPALHPEHAVSRRRLLLGAAAGALAAPWLGGTAAAATPGARRPARGMRTDEGEVSGRWHPEFKRVRREFITNFRERGEVGASVCVVVEGETVIDLWGGIARPETGEPWQAETVSHLWSATKGATALCAHLLVERGALDIHAPVVEYWPEFGQQGKEGITVAMLLGHQAGLPALRARLPRGAFYDWELMTTSLAAEAPFWEPGTRTGYHALTFGFLVGELVRRVSGKTLGTFFRDEVAEPLGLDFWLGLPEEDEARVAPMIFPDPAAPGEPLSVFFLKALTDPTSIPALAFFNTGGYTDPGESETRAAHAAEIGAAGGMSNARSLARMYAAAAGTLRGRRLLEPDTVARMGRTVSATGQDATGFIPSRFALGFVKSIDNRGQPAGMQDSAILTEDAFGHSGFGGCIGFADPRARVGFGYTMNKMGQGTLLNPRGQSLVDALYQSLGYTSDASGGWVQRARGSTR